MQGDPEFLSTVEVSKARRICNDGFGDEWLQRCVIRGAVPGLDVLVGSLEAGAITSLDARSPTALHHAGNLTSSLPYIAAAQGIKARHEAGVLYHERHQLGGIATDVEEL